MTVRLIPGDCLRAMRLMAALGIQVDSIACDPPYHLTSIMKRFGAEGAAAVKPGKTGAYKRASAGFMGKKWDGGDIAFDPETWKLAMAVLKPGGHLLAFGGTRGWHRMAVAIEDAGFEIRDTVAWLYGAGFPKSHNVSKGIDKLNGREFEDRYELGRHIKECRKKAGVSRAILNTEFESIAICNHWEAQDRNNASVPTPEHWERLKQRLGCDARFDNLVDRVGAEREVIGVNNAAMSGWNTDGSTKFIDRDITISATPEAEQWDGWGTALKPAFEPIVLARKPLGEKSVAANVLAHGTGAINVGACRIGEGTGKPKPEYKANGKNGVYGKDMGGGEWENTDGRWPANVCHDGGAEVEAAFAAFGDRAAGGVVKGHEPSRTGDNGIYGQWGRVANSPHSDSGSAARFFYSAKAGPEDRFGSKHPTVKPVALMRWLVRMITPPGGLVLDPFAGSGSTGIAAIAEGMRAILIEADPEHQADIREHLAWATGKGRHALSSKARNKEGAKHDDLPLFAEAAE